MDQTNHYQLSQWESTDRILMENFNGDNAKIDAALKANADAVVQAASAFPVQKLADYTAEAAGRQLDIPLTGVDCGAYHELWVYAAPGTGTTASQMMLRVNGLTAYIRNGNTRDWLAGMSLATPDPWECDCLFHLRLGRAITGECAYTFQYLSDFRSNSFGDRYVADLSPSALTSIQLYSFEDGQVLGAGTQVGIYGLKR